MVRHCLMAWGDWFNRKINIANTLMCPKVRLLLVLHSRRLSELFMMRVLRGWVRWCWSLDKIASCDFWGRCKNIEITWANGRWTRVDFYKIPYGGTFTITTDITEEKMDWGVAEGRKFRAWTADWRAHRRIWARKSTPDRFYLYSIWLALRNGCWIAFQLFVRPQWRGYGA